jgi:hypothetical protein
MHETTTPETITEEARTAFDLSRCLAGTGHMIVDCAEHLASHGLDEQAAALIAVAHTLVEPVEAAQARFDELRAQYQAAKAESDALEALLSLEGVSHDSD